VAAEQEEGFVVRDRRGGSGPDRPSASVQATSGIQPHQEAASSDPHHGPGIPVTFSSFVISLGSSSMMLMGEQLDPQQPPMPPNLPQAKDIIDLLSVLEDKTKGNLTMDEQAVLRDMLYALRMKYVSLAAK
jgi:hypothetical protein